MAGPFQGLQRRTGASGYVPAGELGTGRPWRCVAPLGKDRAITCETRLAVNHFPTR